MQFFSIATKMSISCQACPSHFLHKDIDIGEVQRYTQWSHGCCQHTIEQITIIEFEEKLLILKLTFA